MKKRGIFFLVLFWFFSFSVEGKEVSEKQFYNWLQNNPEKALEYVRKKDVAFRKKQTLEQQNILSQWVQTVRFEKGKKRLLALRSIQKMGVVAQDVTDSLLFELTQKSEVFRFELVKTIGMIARKHTNAISALRKQFLKETSYKLKMILVWSIVEIDRESEETQKWLLGLKKKDWSDWVREQAVEKLGDMTPFTNKLLREIFASTMDESMKVRRAAREVLLYKGNKSVLFLSQKLRSTDWKERYAACWTLYYFESKAFQAQKRIAQLLGDTHPLVKEAAIWAIGSLGQLSSPLVRTLLPFLNEKSYRWAAVIALGKIGFGAQVAVAQLQKMLNVEKDLKYKEAIRNSIALITEGSLKEKDKK